jgi:release factor glutamine methyltransferase
VARGNAERAGAGVSARVELRAGDLWTAVGAGEQFDVIVANPPYVRTAELAGLAPEVKHEPVLALDGGTDGLDVIRRLVDGLGAHAAAGALVAIEHGFDQGADVRALLDGASGFVPAVTRNDLAGKPRVTWTRRAIDS